MSRLNLDMGNQIEGFLPDFFIIGGGLGFHDLNLIPLALMATVRGVRV